MKFELESDALRNFVSAPFCESGYNGSNANWPTISIVVPSLNQGRFLEKTILSVLNQSYPKCELIIIDGGSTDGTTEIIRKYERKISYWVCERDSGQSDALNKGMRVARGDFIGWQNSDDIYVQGAFSDFARAQDENPGYEIYFGNRYRIDEDDSLTMAEYLSTPSLFYYKYRGMGLTNQAAFFRRDMLLKYGDFDVSLQFAMDNEFFLRALLSGARAFHVPKFWGALRSHRAAKGQGGFSREWAAELAYIREKHKIPTGVRYWINNKLAVLIRLGSLLGYRQGLIYHCKFKMMRTFQGKPRGAKSNQVPEKSV
jgi:glycosyltransferase involved in cell wall biosynthesis